MDKYYYLVASLPMLAMESEKFIPIQEFLSDCHRLMDQDDYNTLTSCHIKIMILSSTLPQTARDWWKWELNLRGELAKLRSKRLHFDEETYAYYEVGKSMICETAKKAFEEKNPLTAERILDKARWDYLSDLERGHYFDLSFLIVYYLKLQLLERQAHLRHDTGVDQFSHLQEKILRQHADKTEKTMENEP